MRDGPSHPLCLLALVVLVVNDHVLKHAVPGVLTGKLSDVAWLIVAPVVVSAVLVRLRVSPRVSGAVALSGAAVAFATLQLWPPLGQAWCAVMGGSHTPDPTDLLCLPLLALAPICWRPARPHRLALPIAALALTATSYGYSSVERCYRLPEADIVDWDPNWPLIARWDPQNDEPETRGLNFTDDVWIRTDDGRDVPFQIVPHLTDVALCPIGGLEPGTRYRVRVGPFGNRHPNEPAVAQPLTPGIIEFETAADSTYEPLTRARCRTWVRYIEDRHPACEVPDTGYLP